MQDPPLASQPRGDTEEELGLMEDTKPKVGRGVGQSVADPYPQPLGSHLNMERRPGIGGGEAKKCRDWGGDIG